MQNISPKYTCPGKVILSGEHSVVYGMSALSAAIKLYTTIQIENGEPDIIMFRLDNLDEVVLVKDLQGESQNKLVLLLQVFVRLSGLEINQGMRIMVHSEIPRAAGLGSSASFAVCLTSSLFHFLKGEQISQELLLRIGVEMENVFHGRRGSGLDVYTVTYGGILKYDKQNGVQQVEHKVLDNEDFKIMLISTGEEKQGGTEQAIYQVSERIRELNILNEGSGMRIIEEMGLITLQMIEGLQQNQKLEQLISRNQKLLDKLTIVTERAREIIGKCQQYGISAKITGAGNGGYCIAVINRDSYNNNIHVQLGKELEQMGYVNQMSEISVVGVC